MYKRKLTIFFMVYSSACDAFLASRDCNRSANSSSYFTLSFEILALLRQLRKAYLLTTLVLIVNWRSRGSGAALAIMSQKIVDIRVQRSFYSLAVTKKSDKVSRLAQNNTDREY